MKNALDIQVAEDDGQCTLRERLLEELGDEPLDLEKLFAAQEDEAIHLLAS